MAIRIVRLGSPRQTDEGLRIGTVRRPPRGVPKERYALDDWYDIWLPNLSPTADLIKEVHEDPTPKTWAAFTRKFRAEMKRPEASHLLDLLAALSHTTSFSIGCFCEDEATCHRSVLRELLKERGAEIRD